MALDRVRDDLPHQPGPEGAVESLGIQRVLATRQVTIEKKVLAADVPRKPQGGPEGRG